MSWAVMALLMASGMVALAAEPMEYAVKAAYLSKFGAYVEWPGSAFASPSSAINLCIVGDDPFGNLIDEAVGAQQGTGRGIVVRRLKSIGRDSGCHIAYLGGDARVSASTEGLKGGNVLVVTDGHNASADAGAIQFVLKGSRVRFTIDEEIASLNGLGISSKLLSLALSVKQKGDR